MAIAVAIQKGDFIYAYDERKNQLFSKTGELYGFTSSTVSIRKGGFIYVYDERGNQISSHSA